MKLIGRLKKLEAAAKEQVRVRAAGIAWTSDHEEYLGELHEGQRLVSDIYITADYQGIEAWSLRDRLACDEKDFGDVYKGGTQIGRVESIEGSLVMYREFAE